LLVNILFDQGCGLANSPNASTIQNWRVQIQTHSPAWRGFFPLSLKYPFYIFYQLFSYLASENTELLASLASVLKNLFTPLFDTLYTTHKKSRTIW
jgi:hypothetical protein